MVQETKIANGLTVMTYRIEGLRSAALGVWVNAGSRAELIDEHGIAHLLEHMAFKGTQNRSAKQIAEEIENVGASVNAYTAREQTAYYIRCLTADTEKSVEILSDILLRSTFPDEELIREKDVVIQEIGEAEDMPDDILFDHLQDLSFPGQILGRATLGTPDTVNGFTARNLKAYMDRNYKANNMIFAASGDVEHDKIVKLAEKYLTFAPGDADIREEKLRWGGGARGVKKDLEQAHIAMALPGVGYHNDKYYISEVFSSVFGGGMSSRLFQEIREKRGLAYSVGSFSANYHDGGKFGFYAGAAPEKSEELLKAVIEVTEQMAENVTEAETNRAKAQIRAGLVMSLERPFNRCEAAVRQKSIFGRTFTPDELMRKIDVITPKDLQDFAVSLLHAGKAAFCVVGPNEVDFAEPILARFMPN